MRVGSGLAHHYQHDFHPYVKGGNFMLPSPFRLGEPTFLHFWKIPICKKFPLPIYYVGQIVLQRIKQPNGEILHPVEIVGFWYTDNEWYYIYKLTPGHPSYKEGVSSFEESYDFELEAI